MVPVEHLLYLGALLFTAGMLVAMTKRNTIMILLGIELMLNASNVNLVSFNILYPESMDGNMFALFIIVIAVCEAAIGLAIVLNVYRHYQTSVPEQVNELKDN